MAAASRLPVSGVADAGFEGEALRSAGGAAFDISELREALLDARDRIYIEEIPSSLKVFFESKGRKVEGEEIAKAVAKLTKRSEFGPVSKVVYLSGDAYNDLKLLLTLAKKYSDIETRHEVLIKTLFDELKYENMEDELKLARGLINAMNIPGSLILLDHVNFQPRTLNDLLRLYFSADDIVDSYSLIYKLIENGGDVEYTFNNKSILAYAISNNLPEAARALIDLGAVIADFDLYNAIVDNLIVIAEVLINSGINVNEGFFDELIAENVLPLDLAIRHNRKEIAQLLLIAGADPNAGNIFSTVIARGDIDLAYFFLSYGADPNAVQNGLRPLEIAIRDGNIRMYDLLIDGGADPTLLAEEPPAAEPVAGIWDEFL